MALQPEKKPLLKGQKDGFTDIVGNTYYDNIHAPFFCLTVILLFISVYSVM